MMALLTSLVLLALGSCSHGVRDLDVRVEGESFHGDELRIYYSIPAESDAACAGAVVTQEGSDLYVDFLPAPLPDGGHVDAIPHPTSELGFPWPIEGFVIRSGAPERAVQVVFPIDWRTFHETAPFSAFVRGLDEALQDEYAARTAALMATMARSKNYDGDIAPELSYASE